MRQLKTLAEASLKESGLPFTSIDVFGTPRRLAVVVHDLLDRSPDQKKVVAGPPAARAKDENGQWTPAAVGFAGKHGLRPSDLTIENDKLCATLLIKGSPARQVLVDLFAQWIGRLEFPKSMVWEPTKFRYPRPLRWITALYGSNLVTFQLAGVRSGRWSYGLGHLSPKKIAITQPGKYAVLLKNQCVLVDPAARQDAVRRQVEQIVRKVHGQALLSEGLLDQVSNLVEHPVAVLGSFDPAYLELPREVLITCLEHHQRFFPVEAERGGKLLPHFVGIRNGMSVHQDTVREGYERVLSARLADARFFFAQDRRSALSAKIDALKGVMFQQKLGSIFDKKERVKKLLGWMGSQIPSSAWLSQAVRAADLGKADLVTDVVREFPELQGIVARIYSGLDGEEPTVAQAAEQHYWPITLTGRLPESDAAAALALADKLDTLAGDFMVGLIPSGSADPYGLRRAAVGVLRILEDREWPLSIGDLIEQSVACQPSQNEEERVRAIEKLFNFFQQRWTAWMVDRGRCRADEAEAVNFRNVAKAEKVIEAIKSFREDSKFSDFTVLFKRANQIIKKNSPTKDERARHGNLDLIFSRINESLFRDQAERALFDKASQVREATRIDIENSNYLSAMQSIVQLKDPVDSFFEKVMVMSEEEELKTNRLKLLEAVVGISYQIADFSKLQNG